MQPLNNDSFKTWAQDVRQRFETVADLALRPHNGHLLGLSEAMRYSVLNGGKRVRALFVYAAGFTTQATVTVLDEVALAVEFVHAYSLIHDDLPCMDNDILRRGKPTCHVQFGEAQAMLAGDALQPEAFLRLCNTQLPANQRIELVHELAYASGIDGMCGGQMIDLSSVGKKITIETLKQMHLLKTGALISAAVKMGALSGHYELYEPAKKHLEAYALNLGLGYQVVDDILDVTSDTATLGKTAGKDENAAKPTYVSILGLEKAKALAQQCREQALMALDQIEENGASPRGCTQHLAALADYVIGRSY